MPRHKLTTTELQAKHMVLCQLATNEVVNTDITQMLVKIPREEFVPEHLSHIAYIDSDIEIKDGRFLLAPLTFARLLQLAEITPSCRVLIIGGGNGYAAAVFCELAGHVVSIDSDSELTAQAIHNAERLKLKDVDFKQVEDMAEGYGLSAPYDVIFINGAVEHLPNILTSQLSIGGRLVAIRKVAKGLGKGILIKHLDGQMGIREYFDASTAILKGFEKKERFIF